MLSAMIPQITARIMARIIAESMMRSVRGERSGTVAPDEVGARGFVPSRPITLLTFLCTGYMFLYFFAQIPIASRSGTVSALGMSLTRWTMPFLVRFFETPCSLISKPNLVDDTGL